MKIKKENIERLRGRKDIRAELISAMNVDRRTVYLWIRENKHNGPLTTAKAIGIVSKGLHVKPSEMFETETIV